MFRITRDTWAALIEHKMRLIIFLFIFFLPWGRVLCSPEWLPTNCQPKNHLGLLTCCFQLLSGEIKGMSHLVQFYAVLEFVQASACWKNILPSEVPEQLFIYKNSLFPSVPQTQSHTNTEIPSIGPDWEPGASPSAPIDTFEMFRTFLLWQHTWLQQLKEGKCLFSL